MPIYANQKTQDVKDKLVQMGCKLYKGGMVFYSGCLVNVPKEFEANVYYKTIDNNGKEISKPQKEIIQPNIFKVRTIMSNGGIKLENNSGIEILSSANTLIECEITKLKS